VRYAGEVGVAGSTSPISPQIAARFTRSARIASEATAAIGALVVVGWLLGVPALFQPHTALGAMKFNTAVCLVLLGVALRLSLAARIGTRVARGLAVAAIAITVLTLCEHLFDVKLGIDELVVRDPTTAQRPGRMPPAAVGGMLLIGLAVLVRPSHWAERLGLVAALSAHVAVLGYLHGARDIYALGPQLAIAPHTALAIYGLGLAVALAEPRARGLIALLASGSPAGMLARRLLPAALGVPVLLALLDAWGAYAGLYSAELGRAMLVAANSAVFVAVIWQTASEIARSDERRRAAEEAVRRDFADARRARTDLLRGNDRLRALAQLSDAFASVATSYQPLLERIARTVADQVGDACQVRLVSDDGESLNGAASAHCDPLREEDYRAYLAAMPAVRMDGDTIGARVARSGQPVCLDTTPAEITQQSEDALRPIVARLGIHALAVVPIRAHQRVIGTLGVMRNTPGRGYIEEDVTLLQDLADRAGLAIDNARLYDLLEQRVLERTAELEATNRELEAFSYSVAHDLRAPLRAISGFSHAVLSDAEDRLWPEDVRHLNQIASAAHRMSELIDDLLELSRISRIEPRRRKVDVSALARRVVAALRESQPKRAVTVEIADGLVAHADPRLLEIVLTNLLGNAWKFTAKRAEARIELAARAGDRPTVFVVRDNGAGFDPAHADKLFGVFHRLHAADEFEGTGIGLATVLRIIERHGGTIWAEAAVDRGATFYFTLQPSITGRAASPRSLS